MDNDINIENLIYDKAWMDSNTPRTLIDIEDPFDFDKDLTDNVIRNYTEEENDNNIDNSDNNET